jgi:dipeptidyl aminopeptidase/acylaminoacyl peptidase
MKRIFNMGALVLCAAPIAFSCGSSGVREIPMEDFFRNSEVSSYQISPSGDYYSYMAPFEKRQNVFVQKIGADSAMRITSETDRSIAGYMWANDKRILYLKDTGGDENYQLYGVNIDGSDLRAYTAIPGVLTQIIDPLEDQDNFIIIATNQRNPQIFDPYRLNLETGEMTMLAENPGNIQGWGTDNEGKLRVAYALIDGVNMQILYRETEDQPFTPVMTTSFKETCNYAAFTADNQQVYAVTNIGRDKDELVLMNPATGEELQTLYGNDKYDLSGIYYSKPQKKLMSASYVGHKETVRHFFDKDYETAFGKMQAQLQGYDVAITSTNKAEDVWIVYAGDDRTRGSYYVYDTKSDKLDKIAEVAPWIKREEMAPMLPVTYQSRDGLEIEAYLTLPVGQTMETAKNLPAVINPHGGPWARDEWGYNPEVQFLANRGYAVLQMNFRGSTGFGRNFTEISYKQWGQTMQDDITDGVQWLIDKGIVDAKKVAIYGGSYGGYATLQGIVKNPDLYACAVDYVGVSNLFTFLQTIPPYWKPMLDMMYEMVGNPVTDSLMLAENSPALHADKITAPLFIAQGANDPRVNKDESDQMVAALKARGVDVEYMVKDNEGHGFHNEENRFDFYRAMEQFFGQHLKGEAVKQETAE